MGVAEFPKKKIALPRLQWQINRSTRGETPVGIHCPGEFEVEFASVAE